MAKKRVKKYKKRRTRRNRRSLGATRYGPIVIALLLIVGIGALLIVGYRYAFPALMSTLGVEWPPPTSPPPTPVPTPTPTPNPIERLDATSLQQEMIPPNDVSYIADPYRYGNEIIFSGGGKREQGGPGYDALYLYNVANAQSEALSKLQKQNDRFFQPIMNEKWIVVLDQKDGGGGLIRAMNRADNSVKTVKEYYDGLPHLALNGDRLCWIERTGSSMDKLYLYDLSSGESVTLATFSGTSYGQSNADISAEEIVWASFDVSQATGSSADSIGAINFIRFDDENKEQKSYSTGMYVHDPKTKGKLRIWSDQNDGPSPSLYMSIDGGAAKLIDTEVNDYGLGDDFVAYVKKETIYLYFWDQPNLGAKTVSREGERCIFAGVSDNTVLWFNTGVSDRVDVVKFADIDLERN